MTHYVFTTEHTIQRDKKLIYTYRKCTLNFFFLYQTIVFLSLYMALKISKHKNNTITVNMQLK